MKKILLFVAAIMTSAVMMAQLNGKKIYVNPGHGSFGSNDRPMATIPYPNLPTTGLPDTCGFYESNTNLWKCLELGRKLEAAGAVVMYSRTACGPWDYVYPYADYTWESYKSRPDYEQYNKALSVIAAEAETFEADYFISVHSNAATDGTATNYPLLLYKGSDATAANAGSKEMCATLWPYLFEMMDSELDPYSYYSKTKMNNRGCDDFYGYTLGVLKQSIPGYLSEGYFHTYQPARHRALNRDYCKQEGIRYYRGIAAYFGETAETKGYIMGTVKDLHEKMSHSLFNYAAKTNDQWVPCNGAVVTLYKGGVEVAKYNVDTLYNGIFYFPDLEPGNDYTLDATCEGYKPLFDEYKEALTVKANETTYPMIYLESTSYEPPKEVFVDYPDAAKVSEVAPSAITVGEATTATFAIEGTIKRTIQRGDSTIILSHTEDKAAHLYLVNNKTGEIANISLEGIDPIDAENAGSYLALSDVALTCNGVLVGCNYIRCQYADNQVDAGYKRGAIQFYRWDSLHVAPVKWVSSQHSCNYNRGDMGMSIAVSGEAAECNVMVTGVTSGSARGMRVAQFSVVDNTIASTFYGKTAYSALTLGEPFLLQLSPRDITKNYVLDGPLYLPSEFALAAASAQDVTPLSSLVADSVNLAGHASYLKYAGHSLMVMPYYNEDTLVAGVRMYDVTEGFSAAKEIKLNATLATPVKAAYAAAAITVSKGNFVIRLVTDGTITTFTTAGVEQPVVANIYAYGLNVTKENDAYTFTFSANENATSADIIFYQNEEEVGRQALTDVVKGENTVTIKVSDLPGEENVATTWAIELRGENVTKWVAIYKDTEHTYGRAFNTVDNSPESDFFGRIYVMDRQGSSASANKIYNGIYVFNQDYSKVNTTQYRGGVDWGNPVHATIDETGRVYFSDWSDGNSGVWCVDPANLEGTYTNFFEGDTREIVNEKPTGVILNKNVAVGSSTPGVNIYGKGADAKLIVYNEDASGSLPKNGLAIYNIGNEDGSLKQSWGEAPSAVIPLTGQGNTEGNVWGTSRGVFVAQNRTSGNNNASATSFKFYDWAGNEQLSSAVEPYSDIIDGTNGGGFVITPDENTLILNNGSAEFMVFDIVWEDTKPILNLRYSFNHGITAAIRQMTLDYAGNLVVTGDNVVRIYTVPTDNNVTVTPAKRSLVVGKGELDPTEVENNELSAVVYSNNGTIFVEAEAGAMIEVYTMLGQRLFAAEATTTMTAIGNVPANIVLVRVNNQVVKVAVK
ncbi:MAG: N-acetylmuramoyl-L-alanine amidase [Paludibacteraceae bacterium]|nr:N-acetylmuramoyl-L-alanine amidase [Paludibacteraceae bacterium]